MTKFRKYGIVLALVFAVMMLVPMSALATTNEISDFAGLKSAFDNGGTYILNNNITMTSAITSSKKHHS